MRLLHVASSYPLTVGDSTAPFMEEMLAALADRGHEVRIIVPRVVGLQEGMRRGVDVVGFAHAPKGLQTWGYGRSLVRADALRAATLVVAPVAMAAMLLAVRRSIRAWSPDVVHLHWLIPQGALASVLPRSMPVVISIHGADARFAIGGLRIVARSAVRRADAVVAASGPILDAVASLDPAIGPKLHVITHGADDQLFAGLTRSRARSKLGIETDEQIVFAVGRLVSKKGFDTLIRAAADPGLAGVRVFIGGSGPEESELRRLLLETQAPVTLLGQLSRETVAEWLTAADVVAIPSRTVGNDLDSGPVVLMEAMAAGTGVVTTPIGMAPDVIQPGTSGLLVDPNSPPQLSAALKTAITQQVAFGNAARKRFEELGSWDRVAEHLEGVYEGLVNPSRPHT